jgi:hypothetical protein
MKELQFKAAPALTPEQLHDFATYRNYREGSPLTKELAKLEVGGDGLIVDQNGKGIYSAVMQYGKRRKRKFSLRKTGENESTIYRVQ